MAITLIASGGVDDYTADDRAALVTKVASLADAQHAAVALRIEAASVRLAFYICTTGTAAAVAMVDRLNASLPNATVASAKLGVSDALSLDIRILDDVSLCSLEPDGYHALQPSPPPFMPPTPPSLQPPPLPPLTPTAPLHPPPPPPPPLTPPASPAPPSSPPLPLLPSPLPPPLSPTPPRFPPAAATLLATVDNEEAKLNLILPVSLACVALIICCLLLACAVLFRRRHRDRKRSGALGTSATEPDTTEAQDEFAISINDAITTMPAWSSSLPAPSSPSAPPPPSPYTARIMTTSPAWTEPSGLAPTSPVHGVRLWNPPQAPLVSESLWCETSEYTTSSLAPETMPEVMPKVATDTAADKEDEDEAKKEAETTLADVELRTAAAWEALTVVEPKAETRNSATGAAAGTEAETEAETEIVTKDRLLGLRLGEGDPVPNVVLMDNSSVEKVLVSPAEQARLTKEQLERSRTPLPGPRVLPGPVMLAGDSAARRIVAAARLARAKEEARQRLAKCVWPPTGMDDPEEQAAWWVGAVTGHKKPEGTSLQAWLKSGVVLCELMSTISPGSVEAPSHAQSTVEMPFRQMENIAAYAKAARLYGVPEPDMFVTVDLFEGKDLAGSVPAVVQNLHSLGRVAQQRGVTGPTLGAHLASTNVRRFSQAQRDEARAMPARWTNRGDSLLVVPKHPDLVTSKHLALEQGDLAQLTQAPSSDHHKIAAAIARRNSRATTAPQLARGPAHSSPRPAHRGNEAFLGRLSRKARGASPFGLSPRFTVPSCRSELTSVEAFEDEDAEETDSPLLRRGPPPVTQSPSAIGWLLNQNQRWRDGTQEFEVGSGRATLRWEAEGPVATHRL